MKTKTSTEITNWPIAPVKDPVDDFFEKLAQTPREWFLEEDGALRYRDSDGRLHCPVSAVTGIQRDFCAPAVAARNMGIDKPTSRAIPASADRPALGAPAIRGRLQEREGAGAEGGRGGCGDWRGGRRKVCG